MEFNYLTEKQKLKLAIVLTKGYVNKFRILFLLGRM